MGAKPSCLLSLEDIDDFCALTYFNRQDVLRCVSVHSFTFFQKIIKSTSRHSLRYFNKDCNYEIYFLFNSLFHRFYRVNPDIVKSNPLAARLPATDLFNAINELKVMPWRHKQILAFIELAQVYRSLLGSTTRSSNVWFTSSLLEKTIAFPLTISSIWRQPSAKNHQRTSELRSRSAFTVLWLTGFNFPFAAVFIHFVWLRRFR